MVRKLYKHEILAYLRIWIPMQIILQSTALLYRLLQLIESEGDVYSTVEGTSTFAYVMSLIVSFALIYVFSIVRFYKNLFTHEGYLTFTLPVTTSQHIFVKLFTATLFMILTILGMLVSFVIITAGDFLFELFRAADYLIKDFFRILPELSVTLADIIFYIIEFAVMMLLSYVCGMLLLYCCIAVGQTFRKNRIVGAVVVFFIYTVIVQVLGSVFSVVFAMLLENEGIYEWLDKTVSEYPYESMHAFMVLAIVGQLISGVIYFAVTHCIINRKLNLE